MRKTAVVLILFLAALACGTAAWAADQAKLTVDVSLDRPEVFWACTFVTSEDAAVAKPARIVLKYSSGLSGAKEKSETIVAQGKKSGRIAFDTDKNELVTLEVVVYDAGGSRLGSSGYQVRNNGQLEFIVVAPPVLVEPQFNWGNTTLPSGR